MSSINKEMEALGKVRSVIRETFEYGNRRAKEIGRENVFDFSLGNPSVPVPSALDDEIARLEKELAETQVAYEEALRNWRMSDDKEEF